MSLDPSQELKMTYTSVLAKNGKPFVSVLFERGQDSCEGSVPDCEITNNRGFSEEEVDALKQYLSMNRRQIAEHAKEISGILKMFEK